MKSDIRSVELVPATAVLVNDRYVGCYYNPFLECPSLNTGQLRAFDRKGNTNLLMDVASVYIWLGAVQEPYLEYKEGIKSETL